MHTLRYFRKKVLLRVKVLFPVRILAFMYIKNIANPPLNTFVLLINIYRMHNLRHICKKSLFNKGKCVTSGPNFEIVLIQKVLKLMF